MRSLPTNARIIACYSTGCFCGKPTLSPGKPFSTEPRFEFRKQAQAYADQHNLKIVDWGKYKTALAESPRSCNHHKPNVVRLDWQLA